MGLAPESKGDIDGALKSFRELENTDASGIKELGMYHQARILFAKGDTDKAKELLKRAREKIKSANSGNPAARWASCVLRVSREPDRRSAPPHRPHRDPGSGAAAIGGMPPGMGDPSQMTPEKLQRLQEQLKRSMQDAKNKMAAVLAARSHRSRSRRLAVKRALAAGALALLAPTPDARPCSPAPIPSCRSG